MQAVQYKAAQNALSGGENDEYYRFPGPYACPACPGGRRR